MNRVVWTQVWSSLVSGVILGNLLNVALVVQGIAAEQDPVLEPTAHSSETAESGADNDVLPQAVPLAQTNPSDRSSAVSNNPNCYWSTQQMGVYREPNIFGEALTVLPAGAIVLIGPGSGQGWVRLQAPVVGWMGAQGLQRNPLQGCNGLGTIVPPRSLPENDPGNIPATNPAATGGAVAPSPAPSDGLRLCEILNPSGLTVRNQPIVHPRTLVAILEAGQHRFRFSDRRVSLPGDTDSVRRDWIYITAPATGWITLRVGDGAPLLAGPGCS